MRCCSAASQIDRFANKSAFLDYTCSHDRFLLLCQRDVSCTRVAGAVKYVTAADDVRILDGAPRVGNHHVAE
jgi:hypothetical protein